MKKITKIHPPSFRELSILLTAVFLGGLIVAQSRSFTGVSDRIGRDARANVFRELQILKTTNENLEKEIQDLESQLNESENQELAVKSVQEEIEKFKMINGEIAVSGPGIRLEIRNEIPMIWLVDMVNELYSAGAEAVSVNKIRLTDGTSGFDTIPNGQVLLNGAIIKPPYLFEAIGDKKTLENALRQPQGILERLRESVKNFIFTIDQKDILSMEKAL